MKAEYWIAYVTGALNLFGAIVAACALWASLVVPALADSTMIKVGVNKTMNAHLLAPDGPGPYPAILLLHTSGGLQSGDLEYAKRLIVEGYVVLVPAFLEAYGIRPQTRQAAFTTYAQSIYADLRASLEMLRGAEKVNGKKLGAIGFSNGAFFALWLAATGDVQAAVSYYGAINGAGTDNSLSRFRNSFSHTSSAVLILHGASDSTVRVSYAIELEEILTAAGSPHEFYQYPGAEHRFDRDRYEGNEAAAQDAWQRTKVFLKKTLN
jgi:carboxymethylenebutenolidase